ncbi:hypothetical protein F5Y08DRAFT_301168 [Xylaria arbuscula]|nr:hypothetical protein F5Y08DRAFT_301168 [Xylaria arbuscula]
MASRWLKHMANPHMIATVLLIVAVCLSTVGTYSPSSNIYILRADSSTERGDATAWFGGLGYCTTYINPGDITYTHHNAQCTFSLTGYNVQEALTSEQDGTSIISIPDASGLSITLTRGIAMLNMVAIAFCYISATAHQLLTTRATGIRFAVSLGGSLLALLFSGIACMFVHALSAYIATGDVASGTTFTTTSGPLVYTTTFTVLCQLAASVVGFYSCIGGKYRCEGGIVLGDESFDAKSRQSSFDEKRSLEI